MLPKPAELRDLSLRCRQAARKATDLGTKRRIADHALALAQLAEQVEREGGWGEFVRSANVELYNRVLAQAWDNRIRATVRALLREEQDQRLSEIRALRMRAEELRTVADQFVVPSAQDSLRRAAANYDNLADHAEAQLAGRASYPHDETA